MFRTFYLVIALSEICVFRKKKISPVDCKRSLCVHAHPHVIFIVARFVIADICKHQMPNNRGIVGYIYCISLRQYYLAIRKDEIDHICTPEEIVSVSVRSS